MPRNSARGGKSISFIQSILNVAQRPPCGRSCRPVCYIAAVGLSAWLRPQPRAAGRDHRGIIRQRSGL
eukprot:12534651-Alexandrium_andersonii.AAC.1